MSNMLDMLKRGVQEYEPLDGVPVRAWNIGAADDLMDQAAEIISEMIFHLEDYADSLDHEGLDSNHVRYVLSKAK